VSTARSLAAGRMKIKLAYDFFQQHSYHHPIWCCQVILCYFRFRLWREKRIVLEKSVPGRSYTTSTSPSKVVLYLQQDHTNRDELLLCKSKLSNQFLQFHPFWLAITLIRTSYMYSPLQSGIVSRTANANLRIRQLAKTIRDNDTISWWNMSGTALARRLNDYPYLHITL